MPRRTQVKHRGGETVPDDPREALRSICDIARRATLAASRRGATPAELQAELVRALGEIGRSASQLEAAHHDDRQAALVDPLTRCPNRFLFRDRLDQALLKAKREGTTYPLLVIDLDRFKQVNETLGHRAGDALLREVANRLRSVLRESDTTARLGSDEFGVLLATGRSIEGALQVADRITEAFAAPVPIEGHEVNLELSIGIAAYPMHGDDSETLLRHADIALSEARRTGSAYSVFASEEHETALAAFKLSGQMRVALDRDEFVLHYQPKVDLRSRRVVGVEALVRWQHPEKGLIMPGGFLPLVERTSMITPLSLRLVDKALGQASRWARAGIDLHVAVNLSPRCLHQPDLPDRIEAMLGQHGVPPPYLGLEITESAIMIDEERALAALNRLSRRGVRVAIDDFGTGFSSLTNLRRYPVRELKIDRSFVAAMPTSNEDAVIVRSLIDLGVNLGLQVVAEGVEDAQTLRTLEQWGCHKVQGFHIARPMASEDLEAWIASSPWKPAAHARPQTVAAD
jgi:diguanylate cyclase (GGDEF)-like protein